jgi:protein TonB
MATRQHHDAFDLPRHALPRLAVVIGIHALALLAFLANDRIPYLKAPVTVMLLANIPAPIVKPPPPPPPPPRPPQRQPKTRQPMLEAAAPPLRDIEAPPRTDIAATIVDVPLTVEVAGGKPGGTGTAGSGTSGTGAGADSGGTPVKVPAVLDPANCKRPRLPELFEARRPTGHVILKVLIDVDGSVADARLARSSGTRILDATALQSVRQCHFVAATVDKVPVPSWELFRFSWTNM